MASGASPALGGAGCRETGICLPPEIIISTPLKRSRNWQITATHDTQGGALISMETWPRTRARTSASPVIAFLVSASISLSKKRNSQQVRRSAKGLNGGVTARNQRESDLTSPWYAFSHVSSPAKRPPGPSRSYST
uniref:Uncharacterized protein n=1 Tax=Alexandrium monilatum TaxID=311494 RepID=A0A7S4PSF1_9DINO